MENEGAAGELLEKIYLQESPQDGSLSESAKPKASCLHKIIQ